MKILRENGNSLSLDPFKGYPRKHFGAIVADPPWHFRARTALQMTNWTSRRDAEKHYDVLGWEDIAKMPVASLAAKHCHLFLWATGPCLQQAFAVMEAWGFRYSSMAFVWVKLKRSHNPAQLRVLPTAESDLHVGLGLTTRHNAEFCLLGRSTQSKRRAKDVREVILSPVREHSRKPDEMYERVERYCDGPYLDLFAQQCLSNWAVWDNDADKWMGPEERVRAIIAAKGQVNLDPGPLFPGPPTEIFS